MPKRKVEILSRSEKEYLMSQNPQIGDIVTFHRNHPHTSEMFPFLHTDLYYLRYEGNGHFIVTGKDHIPWDAQPTNES
ncbi:MAG: hypothetical protein UW35_C0038G0003 [Candidatus Collierbacteria bacterium GW2011_GWF2_44_15]|uniref:Uncharacterized protein n=2 Tax=Candidatus Collieribacteriota TaxID=1752725 RepID=A0A0G1HEU6_9BACT|nr:MAG: hypothetical protein UW35_C0038G0003 [Candidatus Collierbacteria bacterium GW2011_GWF2_44_15]